MGKYVISQDKQSGAWYAHMEGYAYIPVFGSIGTKDHAKRIAAMYNKSIGKGK